MPGHIYIGTSGWSYRHWKEIFYQATPKKDWLNFYAQRLNTVEINGTFYRLQQAATFEKWFLSTPDDFRFSLKANRYLTHNKKLLDPETSIDIEREHAMALGEKLAIVLWQFPANFTKNISRLQSFVNALTVWPETSHVIEFRHESWFDTEVEKLLTKYEIAVCQSDAADWPFWPAIISDIVYIRLHGHTETYVSSYSRSSLQTWAEKISHWKTNGKQVFVYFDNDANAHAPLNAIQLREMLSYCFH